MAEQAKKRRGKIVVDPAHTFQPVICTAVKKNSYICNSFLGEIETSRPNITKHHCSKCGTTYRHTVSEDGLVEWETTEDVTLGTEIIAKVRKCQTR